MLVRRREKLALIHCARKFCNLDDTAYRALLAGSAGVESASNIETEAQFEAVMSAFETLGFHRQTTRKILSVSQGGNPGFCTARQIYYIKGLWELASRAKDETSLRAMIRRISKVDDISFLKKAEASKVILALRDICWKAGINPDGPAPRCTPRIHHNIDFKRGQG